MSNFVTLHTVELEYDDQVAKDWCIKHRDPTTVMFDLDQMVSYEHNRMTVWASSYDEFHKKFAEPAFVHFVSMSFKNGKSLDFYLTKIWHEILAKEIDKY